MYEIPDRPVSKHIEPLVQNNLYDSCGEIAKKEASISRISVKK